MPTPLGRVDWSSVAAWLLAFSLVAYLGLKGGGYDPLVHDQVGIAVWWIALAAVSVGALPRRRLAPVAWLGLGLLAAFVLWTALSLSWTESTERTFADLARVLLFLGVFALALFSRGSRDSQQLVGAVASAIVLVAGVALLSRLHPAWFPAANQTARFLSDSRERLSYPLFYWNALAALIAIGLPLLLQLAACAKSTGLRAAAAAALPALALTMFFTLSRGGIAAAAIALVVFLAFAPDRLPKLLSLLVAGIGGAVLIAVAAQRDSLRHGIESATAHHQGNDLLALTVVVCVAVGLGQLAVAALLREGRRPPWTVVSRRLSIYGLVAGALTVLVVAAAVDAPRRASDAWDEFKREPGPGQGAERLGSLAGESRYEFWSAAVKENATKPLTGTGSGTFEFWWARNATNSSIVRDTHSLYLQTLGELGIVGLVLLLAFLLSILVAGGTRTVRSSGQERAALAAALAGCLAFCLTAAVDWMWQIPALPVALLLLGSALLTASSGGDGDTGRLPVPLRGAFAVSALAAIAAIAVPLASTSQIRQSQADFRAGRLPDALATARSAANVEPDFAGPHLQQALVLEAEGDLTGAASAARSAADRERTNWRNWLVLARIEAERGRAGAAVRAYRRARSLNPRSPIFER